MPIVIARLEPKFGAHDEVVEALKEHVPHVHAEHGCELYAVHSDGQVLIIVERWASGSALKAHSTGPIFAELNDRLSGLLSAQPRIDVVRSVPLGETARGASA